MRFARIWWTRADDNDATPGRLARPDMAGAKPFLLAPESKTAEIVYLMVSETMLTHARLWNIEIDKGGIRTKLATKVKPSGGIEQTHAFNIATSRIRRTGARKADFEWKIGVLQMERNSGARKVCDLRRGDCGCTYGACSDKGRCSFGGGAARSDRHHQ